MKTSGKRGFRKNLALILRGYRVVFAVWGKYIPWNLLQAAVSAVMPFFSLYMTRAIIDELTTTRDIRTLTTLALVTLIGLLLIRIVHRLIQGRVHVYGSDTWRKDLLFYLKTQNHLRFDVLENPDITLLRESIFSAKYATGGGLQILLWNIDILFRSIIDIVFSVCLTFSLFSLHSAVSGAQSGFLRWVQSPVSALIVLALIIANAAISIVTTNAETQKVNHEWQELARQNTRFSCLTHIFSADAYLFKMHPLILRAEEKLTRPAYILRAQKHKIKYGTIRIVWNHLMMAALYTFIAAKVYVGDIGIGSFLLYQGTVARFIAAVSEVALIVGKLIQNNDPLEKLFEYLDLPSDDRGGIGHVGCIDAAHPIEIEFQDVSYRYPGSNQDAVSHASFRIRQGQSLALVGPNGSGKSTMIKLLCRLYTPTAGRILLNGVDIALLDHREYIALLSVVFQDLKLFSFSIGENLSADSNYDRAKAQAAMETVGLGAYLASLEDGLDTYLHKDYVKKGVNVSGGEAQKIAIARAVYKDAPVYVFDEPTASLDAIAEAEVYRQFHTIRTNKTSIFISHRLSSCRFCDEIIVLDHGAIVQTGSHDALVKVENGLYHTLWQTQAQYYVEET